MKIRNEQGIEIVIPKNLQNKVKRAIQNGEDIDSLIKPLMKNGGKLPKAEDGLITDNTLQNSLGQPLNLNQNNFYIKLMNI
jgi:transcriptional regulator